MMVEGRVEVRGVEMRWRWRWSCTSYWTKTKMRPSRPRDGFVIRWSRDVNSISQHHVHFSIILGQKELTFEAYAGNFRCMLLVCKHRTYSEGVMNE